MKIIAIDDDEFILAMMQKILVRIAEIHVTVDHNVFLELVSIMNPDLLLIDLYMPEKSGIQIMKELRDKNIQIPILVVSGNTNKTIKNEALKYCNGYLKKPFNKFDLLEEVQKMPKK